MWNNSKTHSSLFWFFSIIHFETALCPHPLSFLNFSRSDWYNTRTLFFYTLFPFNPPHPLPPIMQKCSRLFQNKTPTSIYSALWLDSHAFNMRLDVVFISNKESFVLNNSLAFNLSAWYFMEVEDNYELTIIKSLSEKLYFTVVSSCLLVRSTRSFTASNFERWNFIQPAQKRNFCQSIPDLSRIQSLIKVAEVSYQALPVFLVGNSSIRHHRWNCCTSYSDTAFHLLELIPKTFLSCKAA